MSSVIDIRDRLLRARNLRASWSAKAQVIREGVWLRRMMQGPPRPPFDPKTLLDGAREHFELRRLARELEENDDEK
jgi:hypothetical protein